MSIALSACGSFRILDKSAELQTDEESIFIIGVEPENFRIFVFPGEIIDKKFVKSIYRPSAVYGGANNGFVVGKARKGDTLAITRIRVVEYKEDLLGADFLACKKARTMVFNVPGGKVIYLGHVKYTYTDYKLHTEYSNDLESAKKYINDNYPKLYGRVVQGEYQLLRTNNNNCQ